MIRVIDLETTGMEPPAEVCEAGWTDFNPETREIISSESELFRVRSIPPEARAVHHIRAEDTEGCVVFDAEDIVRQALDDGIKGMAAHMASFEAKWIGRQLEGVMHLICTYKAALRRWPDAPSHSNFGLLYWLEDQGKIEIDQFNRDNLFPAHRAGPDSRATALILKGLYAEGVTGKEMVLWTSQPAMLPRLPIGKEKGKPWREVSHGFLEWMCKQPEMDPDLKWLAGHELDRRNER